MDDVRELWSGQSVYVAGGGNDDLTVRLMDIERGSVLKHRRPSENSRCELSAELGKSFADGTGVVNSLYQKEARTSVALPRGKIGAPR
jgi:hypothetical protein